MAFARKGQCSGESLEMTCVGQAAEVDDVGGGGVGRIGLTQANIRSHKTTLCGDQADNMLPSPTQMKTNKTQMKIQEYKKIVSGP